MNTDFDRVIPRSGTCSVKYDGRGECFGKEDVLPLWVADMDFAAPAAVQRALAERASHPVYGYTRFPQSMYDALVYWLGKRHGWAVERDWIMPCPGVVPSLYAAIIALCRADEAVIVQPPVYAPFLTLSQSTGRRLMLNPLKLENGRYAFDLAHFEQCAAKGARLLLLCSPHNPVGRVWQEHELGALLDSCRRHGITVISDEIHADLIYPGGQHLPLARLAGNPMDIITAVAPSKTFNIPGLGLSALIVPDKEKRAAIGKAFDMLHVSAANPFSIAAFEAAYMEGEAWLDELMRYLAVTRDFVRDYLQRHLPRIRLIEPEGSYLLWLDCRAMGLDDRQLKHFFIHEAAVGLSPGMIFGEEGSGFMRMNIGAPRKLIAQALQQIASAEQARTE